MANTKELLENTENLANILETLIKTGQDKGYITYEDVADAYEDQEDMGVDQIDKVYEKLEKAHIKLTSAGGAEDDDEEEDDDFEELNIED